MGQETILIIIKQEARRGSILGQCLLREGGGVPERYQESDCFTVDKLKQ